jgi:hypothetical protein
MKRHAVVRLLPVLALVCAGLYAAPGRADPLAARDLDGNGSIDAWYDSAQNITWLADANAGGNKNWNDARVWAHQFSIGGIGNGSLGATDYWRLPTMVDVGNNGCEYSFTGHTDCGYNVERTPGTPNASELAYMFHDILGNLSFCAQEPVASSSSCTQQNNYGLTNAGPFTNLGNDIFWTGSVYLPRVFDYAWYFSTYDGSQDRNVQFDALAAWAVHPGDVGVAPVPLPASVWLMLSGLLGMAVLQRQQRRSLGYSTL